MELKDEQIKKHLKRMKKTIFFFIFIFVFAVLVAGAQNKIPDLSKGGEYNIPKLCLSGEDSEYKFKIGSEEFVLKMSKFESLETKYPAGEYTGSGAKIKTTDNKVLLISNYVFNLEVNGKSFGEYGGPESEARIVGLVQISTSADVQKKLIYNTNFAEVYSDSYLINGVFVTIHIYAEGDYTSGEEKCMNKMKISSEGMKYEKIDASLGEIVTLTSGIPREMEVGGREYFIEFLEIKNANGNFLRYDLRVTPSTSKNIQVISFQLKDLTEGKPLALKIPAEDSTAEAAFLFTLSSLWSPGKTTFKERAFSFSDYYSEEKGFTYLVESVDTSLKSRYTTPFKLYVPKTTKGATVENTLDGKLYVKSSQTFPRGPFPPALLNVAILGGEIAATKEQEKKEAKPAPSHIITSVAKGTKPISLPKDVGVKLSETFQSCTSDSDCDDGTEYTIEFCSKTEQKCTYYLKKGWCQINFVGYELTKKNPINSCEICQSDIEPLKWTTLPNCVLGKQSDVNNDGSVNKEDVLFIKNNPQKVWTEKLNKDIKNLNKLIKEMINNWS